MVVDHELFLKGVCSLIGQIFDDFDITQFLSAMDFLENLDDTLSAIITSPSTYSLAYVIIQSDLEATTLSDVSASRPNKETC